ncbi:hypothetical protein CCYA_CCYA05G1532 [Cyanidiococcus yangmingshanensis]|nr:hypothetical protein CCYA_CCYA05G1532 [Cyanidiococcus yangmingshanensis]
MTEQDALPKEANAASNEATDGASDAYPSKVVFRLFPVTLTLNPTVHRDTAVNLSSSSSLLEKTIADTALASVRLESITSERAARVAHQQFRDEQPSSWLDAASTSRLLHLQEASLEWHAGETAPVRLELTHKLPYNLEQFRVRVEVQDASETLLLLDRSEETLLPPERSRAWSFRIPFTGHGSCQVTCMLLFHEPVTWNRQRLALPGDVLDGTAAAAAERSPGAAPLRTYRQLFQVKLEEAWHLDACAVFRRVTCSEKRTESRRQPFFWIVHLQNHSQEAIYLLDSQCRPAVPEFHGNEKPLQPPDAVPYIATPTDWTGSTMKAPAGSSPSTPPSVPSMSPFTWRISPARFRSTIPLLCPGDQVRLAFLLQRRVSSHRSAAESTVRPTQLRPAGLVIRWRTIHGVYGEQTWPLVPTRCLDEDTTTLGRLRDLSPRTVGEPQPRCRIEVQCCNPSARVRIDTPVTIRYTIWYDWPERSVQKQLHSEELQAGRSLRLEAEALPGTLLPIGNCSRHLESIFPGSSCSVCFSYLPLRVGCFPIPSLTVWTRDARELLVQSQHHEPSLHGSPGKRPFGHLLLYVYR